MLTKIIELIKNRALRGEVKMKARTFIDRYQDDIILIIGAILISLLSFAMGYIAAKQQEKEPIKIEYRIQNIECRIT